MAEELVVDYRRSDVTDFMWLSGLCDSTSKHPETLARFGAASRVVVP